MLMLASAPRKTPHGNQRNCQPINGATAAIYDILTGCARATASDDECMLIREKGLKLLSVRT